MNEHNEIPNYQDELLQLNELLERLNQAGYKALGSININIYKPGCQHVDRVETQYIGASPPAQASPPTPLAGERGVDSSETTKGLPEEKARLGEGGCLRQKRGGELPFGADTPLSALFRKNHHEELRKRIESWRPYLKSDAPETDALLMTWFEFDKDRIYANKVYRDLCELDHMGALNNSLSCLARYLAGHSNLSRSYSTLYQQLKLYRSESR